ncbi:MAG: hypothetical protein ABSF26_16585 [Thermoguttaceae bacterium]
MPSAKAFITLPNEMSRDEAQTRFELIDPTLVDRGWDRSDIRIEETLPAVDIVYGKGRRRPKGRTDYVLRRSLGRVRNPVLRQMDGRSAWE